MSLIHADNFNIYGAVVAEMTASGRYSDATGAIVGDPDGFSPLPVMRFADQDILRRALKAPDGKVGMCGRFWLGSLPGNNAMNPVVFTWADAANRPQAMVQISTTGSALFYIFDTTDGAFGNWFLIYATPGPVITAGAWWHLAAQFDITGGEFSLWVEGVRKIHSLAADWGGHLHNGPLVYQCSSSSQMDNTGHHITYYIKDYVWWDGEGTQNNDYLGAVLVAEIDPTADVDIGGWAPSTGVTAWNILDQNPANAPYVAAGTPPPDPMEMELANLPAEITSVKGILTIIRAGKVDGGDGKVQVSMISVGDASLGEDRPITAGQADWEDFHELDPHTAAPWTPGAVDLATIRVDRTL